MAAFLGGAPFKDPIRVPPHLPHAQHLLCFEFLLQRAALGSEADPAQHGLETCVGGVRDCERF